MRKDFGGAEPASQLGLSVEPRHHGHTGVQRAQDRERTQSQRADPVDQDPAAG